MEVEPGMSARAPSSCWSCGVAWRPAAAPGPRRAALLTGTLKTIKDRGTILIGYREGAVPFSFLNKAGQPVGFSLDLCHGIASDVARTLNSDLLEPDAPAWQTGVRLVYVPVAADARLPKHHVRRASTWSAARPRPTRSAPGLSRSRRSSSWREPN